MSVYKSDEEIFKIVCKFENCSFRREEWRHAEHLIVALYYVFHHDYETAYAKMRGGIFKLLESFEIDLTKEMPYHETLTIFWLRTVDEFAKSKKNRSIIEISNEMIERFHKDYPLKFYSRDFLFSKKVRGEFHEPDLKLSNDFNLF